MRYGAAWRGVMAAALLACGAPPTASPPTASPPTASPQGARESPAAEPTAAPATTAASSEAPAPSCVAAARACADEEANECLEAVSWSGGESTPTHVLRWRDRDRWTDEGRLPLPHFVLSHVRALRDAYASAAPGTERWSTCQHQLRDQVDFLLSSTVQRGDARVWENQQGVAQAMEQAEYAHALASVAAVYARAGQAELARRYVDAALQLGAALDRPVGVRTGGVRSESETCAPDDDRACFFFHSRGSGVPTDETRPRAVLNQHLHAVRDSVNLYRVLRDAPELLPSDRREEVLRRVLRRAAGGLSQLAFSRGWSAADRRPPNLAQFMERFERPADGEEPTHFYWAFYELDVVTGRGRNISRPRTCHYHTHALKILADIVRALEDVTEAEAGAASAQLHAAAAHLLRRPDEPVGAPDATHAVHQFLESEARPELKRARRCPQPSLDRSDPAVRALTARMRD